MNDPVMSYMRILELDMNDTRNALPEKVFRGLRFVCSHIEHYDTENFITVGVPPNIGYNDGTPRYKYYGNMTLNESSNQTKTYQNFMYGLRAKRFDWILKADDDTYVAVENLRRFLYEQRNNITSTFGYNFKTILPNGYHSGGGGYVFSRAILLNYCKLQRYRVYTDNYQPRFHTRKMYIKHFPFNYPLMEVYSYAKNASHYNKAAASCDWGLGAEDVVVSKCLQVLGATPGDSRDNYGRHRFHYLSPGQMYADGKYDWMVKYPQFINLPYEDSFSRYFISMHYVKPHTMYLISFITTHLSIAQDNSFLPKYLLRMAKHFHKNSKELKNRLELKVRTKYKNFKTAEDEMRKNTSKLHELYRQHNLKLWQHSMKNRELGLIQDDEITNEEKDFILASFPKNLNF
ncbi:hypothetical protein SNEBB_001581 [Seison nebaliae]|nr:hypothetical protein SNEBB_001581 [Seison nebaliae]